LVSCPTGISSRTDPRQLVIPVCPVIASRDMFPSTSTYLRLGSCESSHWSIDFQTSSSCLLIGCRLSLPKLTCLLATFVTKTLRLSMPCLRNISHSLEPLPPTSGLPVSTSRSPGASAITAISAWKAPSNAHCTSRLACRARVMNSAFSSAVELMLTSDYSSSLDEACACHRRLPSLHHTCH